MKSKGKGTDDIVRENPDYYGQFFLIITFNFFLNLQKSAPLKCAE